MRPRGSRDEPSTLGRVREVFASEGFRRLFTTRAVSQLGDGMFQLAAADLLLFDRPTANPALTLTLLGVVTLIPFSVISPFVGVFIDRWDRRRILEIVPIVRAVGALIIGLGVGRNKQGVDFYLIVLVVLSANRLFLSTMSAVLPQLVPEEDLLVANSVASTGGSIANVIGLGIGGGLSALIGGTRAAGAAAIAFGAGAFVAHRLDVRRGTTPSKEKLGRAIRTVIDEMSDGFGRLRRNRRVSFALSAVIANQIAVGAMSGGLAVFYISVLHLKVASTTLVLGALTAGLGIGVVAVPWLGQRIRHDRLIPLSFAVACASAAFAGATLSRYTVVAGAIGIGVAYAMTKIPVDTIVQEEMPDSHRGRAFAIYDMLFNFARVAGTALAGVAVVVAVSPRAVVGIIAASYAVFTVVFASRERKLHRVLRSTSAGDGPPPGDVEVSPARAEGPARSSVQPPAELFPVGELITVRSYAGHRADVEPRILIVGGREVPVEAIEWQAFQEQLNGERRRVFVVRAAGQRVRLASSDESSRWEVERVLPPPPD